MEITDALKQLNSKAAMRDNGQILVWDIITALRGPDCSNERLKELTTAKIRKAIGLTGAAMPGYVVAKDEYLTTDEKRELDVLLRDAGAHFTMHYANAVEAIKELYGINISQPRPIDIKVGHVYDIPNWGKFILTYRDAERMILVSSQGRRLAEGLPQEAMAIHLTSAKAVDLGPCKGFALETVGEQTGSKVWKGLQA